MNQSETGLCHWIGSNSRLVPMCECRAVPGRNYCEQHLWRVYQAGTAVNRRRDRRRAAAVWDFESEFNAAVAELEAEGYNFDEPLWADTGV